MTNEEHKLMVFMFARVYERTLALTEALIAKGTLDHDDVKAYEEFVQFREDEPPHRQFSWVAKQYEDFAEGLGIDFSFAKANKSENPNAPKAPDQ